MVKTLEKQLMLGIATDVINHFYAAQAELEETRRADFAGIAERLREARRIIGRRCDLDEPLADDEPRTGISRESILRQISEDVARLNEFMEAALVADGQLSMDSARVFRVIALDLDNLLAAEPLVSAGRKTKTRD
ncbi:MAG: hypothetical protein WCT10_00465 [Patescibacteria group bacterium]|jgi:hypothetical protein